MHEFDGPHLPPTVTPEIVEAAMKRAHGLRSEAIRELYARIGRRLAAAPGALVAAAQRRAGAMGAVPAGAGMGRFAPTRVRTAPRWRAALQAGAWADTARCDGS